MGTTAVEERKCRFMVHAKAKPELATKPGKKGFLQNSPAASP